MPILECQACGMLTQFGREAQEHNIKDRNHYFKRTFSTLSIRDILRQSRRK